MDEKSSTRGNPFIHLAWLRFAGLFGMQETEVVLIKKPIKHPSEIFYSICFFLRYWSGLHAGEA
jgi:hypothetical protein